MNETYLLYIDILGFAHLVEREPARVDDLFEIIASLNLHRHESFSSIVFSDTILVHNVHPPQSRDDHAYLIMYQCEFFRDLLHRLAGREISLRGVMTYGQFSHYRLDNVSCYYGPALIDAYRAEKALSITGLLMDEHCRSNCSIFSTLRFSPDWHYAFVTQALDTFEDVYDAMVPLPRMVVEGEGLGWYLGPELEVMAHSHRLATSHGEASVRAKHIATLAMYRRRYPKVFAALEQHAFAMEAVSSEFDWDEVRRRFNESFARASTKRPPITAAQSQGES